MFVSKFFANSKNIVFIKGLPMNGKFGRIRHKRDGQDIIYSQMKMF